MKILCLILFSVLNAAIPKVDPLHHQLSIIGSIPLTKGVVPVRFPYTANGFFLHLKLQVNANLTVVNFLGSDGANFCFSRKHKTQPLKMDTNTLESTVLTGIDEPHLALTKVECQKHSEVTVLFPSGLKRIYFLDKQLNESYFSYKRFYQLLLGEEILESGHRQVYFYENSVLTKIQLYNPDKTILIDEVLVNTENQTTTFNAYGQEVVRYTTLLGGYELYHKGLFCEFFKNPTDSSRGFFIDPKGEWTGFDQQMGSVVRKWTKDHKGKDFLLENYQKNIFPSVNITMSSNGTTSVYGFENNRLDKTFKVANSEYFLILKELEEKFSSLYYMTPKKAFFDLCLKKGVESKLYFWADKAPFLSKVMQFCKNRLSQVDIFHFHELVLTQLKRYMDSKWDKFPTLEFDGKGGFTSLDSAAEIIDFYYHNKEGVYRLTHKKIDNGLSETFYYNDSGQRICEELALNGKIVRAKRYQYNQLGLIDRIIDYDPNTPIQKEICTRYNSLGQVLEQIQKSPTQHHISTLFEYDERHNVQTKAIYNSEGRLTEKIAYQYDNFDRQILEKSSLGTGIKFKYDNRNHLVSKKDIETGLKTDFLYDQQGQMVSVSTLRGTEKIVLDPFKRPLERVDIHHTKTVQKWGENNKLVEVCLPLYDGKTQSIHYRYDNLGYVKEEEDPEGNTFRYKNDLFGNKKEVQIGQYTSYYQYNKAGKLLSQKIEDQNIQQDILDPLGRIIESITPQKTTYFTYNGFDIVSKKCSDGLVTHYSYDDLGRLIEEKTQNGRFCSTKKTNYDPNGKPAHIEFIEKGQHIFRNFDDRGRLIEEKIMDGKNRIESYKKWVWGFSDLLLVYEELIDGVWAKTVRTYDEIGRETMVKDPMGRITIFSYNDHFMNEDLQEVVQIRKEFNNGTVEITTLDVFGRCRVIELLDPFKNLVKKERFTRDFKGQILIHSIDYQTATGTKTYQNQFKYDTSGKLIQKIKNAHTRYPQLFTYTYDKKGRIVCLEKPDGVCLTYEYNDLGDLTAQRSSDKTVEYHYEYDQNRRLTRVFNPLSQTFSEYKYSLEGLMIEERLENGLTFEMGYNSEAELNCFSSPSFGKVEYQYGSFGVEEIFYHTQKEIFLFHITKTDGKGLIKKITSSEDIPSTIYEYNLNAQPIRKVHFGGYDYLAKFNSMGSVTKRMIQDYLGKYQIRYSYDTLDRLEKGSDEQQERSYNGLGILSFLGDTSVLTDSALRIKKIGTTHFQYDPQGNRALKKDSSTETRYTFDALDRLIQIKTRSATIHLKYDFKNRLVSKKVIQGAGESQTDYLYHGDIEIGSISKQTNELLDFRVVFQEPHKRSHQTLFAMIQNTPFYVTTDIFKNVTGLSHAKKNTHFALMRYDAFGNRTVAKGDICSIGWMYQGKRWHSEFELYQFEHRFYDPSLAVFISCDPEGEKNGVYGHQYALCNPLKYEDYQGLYPIDFSFSVDFSLPVHRLLNLAYEGKNFSMNDFFSGLTLQTTLPLDTFCSSLKNTSSHLAQYLYSLIEKDRTRLEKTISKSSSTLLSSSMDVDLIPAAYQLHPMVHRVSPDTKNLKISDGFVDIFMNGIWNSLDDATSASKAIANFLQKDVILVYNPTFGYFKDLIRAIGNKRSMKKGNASDLLYHITNHIMDLSAKEVRLWAHSEGALNARIAYEEFPEAKRDRLTIFTFGAGELIPNCYGRQVVNFISDTDAVALNANAHILSYHAKDIQELPFLSSSSATIAMFWDKKRTHIDHKYNVTILKSDKLVDHYFLGDTYQSAVSLAMGT